MVQIKTKVDNVYIQYIKKGEGKAVLILPGWGTTIETYRNMIDAIATYARVYCLDIPGFGNSQEPEKSWHLEDYVDCIIHFIEKQHIQEINLIGHSNGGRILIRLMNRKDLSFKVNRIILIGSAGIIHQKTGIQRIKIQCFKLGKRILELKQINAIFPNALIKLKQLLGSKDYKEATPIMRQSLVYLVNEDLQSELENIMVPTLLIWGEQDKQTPIEDAEIMQRLIPNAMLLKIEGSTHYVFLEKPDYVNEKIKAFLKKGGY